VTTLNLKGRRLLVTGAGGFIGSHLCEGLVELEADVRALVRYSSTGQWGWLEQSAAKNDLEVIMGDVRDYFCVRDAMQGCDAVFHLAALIGIPYSYRAPQSYLHTNVEGTLNILQAARIVCTSTSEVYGSAQYVPIDEKHPLQGQSPYSASKIGADKLAESYYLSFGVPITIARPFNTYGPRQSARAVIPTIITQALRGEKIKIGSLAPTRDFNFVTDTVAGFIRMLSTEEAIGEVFNLGSGREISIGELIGEVGNLVGSRLDVVEEEDRVRPEKSEVQRLCADASKAHALLGWSSRVDLREGLRQTIQWIESNLSEYRAGAYAV
jgi:NAD dependent epimerase/dehydratase